MTKKEITINYLTEIYNDLAGIFKDCKNKQLKIIIAEKLESLENAITIVKTRYKE